MKMIIFIISVVCLAFAISAQEEPQNNELEQIFNNIISNVSEEEMNDINVATEEKSSDSASKGDGVKTSEVDNDLLINAEVQLDKLPLELKERVLQRMKEIEASREEKVKAYKK